MNSNLITKHENEKIIELTPDEHLRFEMLEDFVLRCNAYNSPVMRLSIENGVKTITALNHVGLITLADGTQIEILPKLARAQREDSSLSRKILYRMLSAQLGIPFEESDSEADSSTFLEFFISIFIRESMKIIKSGLLSGYVSVEENSPSVRGSILFAENIRKNLVHKERLYVRHDEFSHDRSENRLMKSTAKVILKLTHSSQNSMNLKKILANLEEVKYSDNYDMDFSKCVNARNTKKYSAVLNICRLFLKNQEFASYSGKYVDYALLFPTDKLFRAYSADLIKQSSGKKAEFQLSGEYLSHNPERFPIHPQIVLMNDGKPETVIETRWKILKKESDIELSDMFRLFSYAKKIGCKKAILLCPEPKDEIADLPSEGCYSLDNDSGLRIYVKFVRLTATDNNILPKL